jgi:hypothetical protein
MDITLYVVLLHALYAKEFVNMVMYSDNLCDPEHNFRNQGGLINQHGGGHSSNSSSCSTTPPPPPICVVLYLP